MGKKKRMKSLQIINPKYINRLLAKENGGENQYKMFSRMSSIPPDAIIKLCSITDDYTIPDCNAKAEMITKIMEPLGFIEVGCGTNRIAFRKHNYIYKVALDDRGRADNINEYKRSPEMVQIFYKVYELFHKIGNYDFYGEILIGEYAELISEAYFMEHRSEIKSILELASNTYIMDDVGLTTKNFCNWGLRTNPDGSESLIIIDNAYFYPIRNAQMITCQCGGRIKPSDDFTYYICKNSACAMHFTVPEILNMSGYDYGRADEEAIEMRNADGTSSFIKISGSDSCSVDEIESTEAETLLSSYQAATTFDASTVNIIENVEEYWNNNTDNDGNSEYVTPYKPLKLN